jgi:hypothetical protein
MDKGKNILGILRLALTPGFARGPYGAQDDKSERTSTKKIILHVESN